MGKCPTLLVFYASMLLVLQTLNVVNAVTCFGGFFNGSSSYGVNRKSLFSTLASKVITNGGFYNASLGNNPNKVYALVLCIRDYKQQACINCVEKVIQNTQSDSPNRMESFKWDNDDGDNVSCLVRSSNHSTFKNLALGPAVLFPSSLTIEPSKNMTLFKQEWDATVNRTLEAATKAENSSVIKYYSTVYAEFTEYPNVYMLMQCTPDITSRDCNRCLGDCVSYFYKQYWGRQGGESSRPSCVFRWDLYAFYGTFDNITRVPAPPRPQAQAQAPNGSSIRDKKGRSISYGGNIAIIVVPTFINILVFIFLIKLYARRRKSNNETNAPPLVGRAEYSESGGQFMLRFDLGMILMATNDFSSEIYLAKVDLVRSIRGH